MAINKYMEKLANEIGGQYSEYDTNKSVIIVPLSQNRFQAVLAIEKQDNGKVLYQITSKVCLYNPKIDLKELLKNNINFNYSRFFIDDDVIRIVAVVTQRNASEEMLKEVVTEVAAAADEWEYKLTGLDVN